jgi:hypothetical protein
MINKFTKLKTTAIVKRATIVAIATMKDEKLLKIAFCICLVYVAL